MGRLSNPQVLAEWARSLKLHVGPVAAPVAVEAGRRRNGWVARLVEAELRQADLPLWPAEVRERIERSTGRQIGASSIKECLRQGALRGRLVKIDGAGYQLPDSAVEG